MRRKKRAIEEAKRRFCHIKGKPKGIIEKKITGGKFGRESSQTLAFEIEDEIVDKAYLKESQRDHDNHRS